MFDDPKVLHLAIGPASAGPTGDAHDVRLAISFTGFMALVAAARTSLPAIWVAAAPLVAAIEALLQSNAPAPVVPATTDTPGSSLQP